MIEHFTFNRIDSGHNSSAEGQVTGFPSNNNNNDNIGHYYMYIYNIYCLFIFSSVSNTECNIR